MKIPFLLANQRVYDTSRITSGMSVYEPEGKKGMTFEGSYTATGDARIP
jgi:hypothetical protein